MRYATGQKVQSTVSGLEGIIQDAGPEHAGIQYYEVFWGGAAGTRMVAEPDLTPVAHAAKPSDAFVAGQFLGYDEFLRIMTYHRLRRDEPLRNNVYAFNASRTELYPYQFKPLMKFLDSVNQRILICDEVGLGKTIEAGLILTELKARFPVRTVLIVCPAALRAKWRLELRRRFDEDFRVLGRRDLLDFIADAERNPDRVEMNGIASLQSVRSESILTHLERMGRMLDLVIVDEAHHMRNFGTMSRRAGRALSGVTDAMVMLTATPVHLGTENLFSLLNILDEDDFPDRESAQDRFNQNQPIVAAQTLMGRVPPEVGDALQQLERAARSSWIRNHPLLPKLRDRLTALAAMTDDDPDTPRSIFTVQRDLAGLNLLSHIFTRTRKREVHVDVAQRRARAVTATFNQDERQFYDAVTELVREECTAAGREPVITQWIINNVQQRLASSIAAFVDFFRDADPDVIRRSDVDEAIDDDDEVRPPNETTLQRLTGPIQRLLRSWPDEYSDAKFRSFQTILESQAQQDPHSKVLVFAFFKHTLRYLERRLRSEGITCVRIDGDVDVDEREERMQRFRDDPSIRVLLSSRVGSEGLDFQFCNTLVNYDLPWNPMEVEQRIGRLDRIGQRHDVILIFNMWTADTIEERVLKRLYDRIGIFERSVGTLDAIIGRAIRELEQAVFTSSLTRDEEERRFQQADTVIVGQLEEQERLEGERAQFLGVDQYFEDEITGVERNRRYVTGQQLRRFLEDFLEHRAPRTRLVYNQDEQRGRLYPDGQLRMLARDAGLAGEMTRLFGASDEGLPVTFERRVAVDHPNIEFLNALHPVTRLVVEDYENTVGLRKNAQAVAVTTNTVPPGTYVFAVFRVRIKAARPQNVLEVVLFDDSLSDVLDADEAEVLLGEIVERGEEVQHGGWDTDATWTAAACDHATNAFLTRLDQQRRRYEEDNEAFVQTRLAGVRAFYEHQIGRRQTTLAKLQADNQPRSTQQLWEGQIQRWETEYEHRVKELESRKAVELEWDEVTMGLVQVREEAAGG